MKKSLEYIVTIELIKNLVFALFFSVKKSIKFFSAFTFTRIKLTVCG